MWALQNRGGLGFALKALQQLEADLRRGVLHGIRPNQLDGGRAREQAVMSLPDLTHAALSEPLVQGVGTQSTGRFQFASQPIDHRGHEPRDGYGEDLAHEDAGRARGPENGLAEQAGEAESDQSCDEHRCGGQGGAPG